jgi:rhodanese-related sulfurtransferase
MDELRMRVDELKRKMGSGEDFTIIDVRKAEAWAESDTMVPESICVPLDELEKNLERIPKKRPAVAYCTRPNEHSSASLAPKLRDLGHENVWALDFKLGRTPDYLWSRSERRLSSVDRFQLFVVHR